MRQYLLLILLATGCFLSFVWYYLALKDWITDVQQGVYARHHVEAVLETSMLLLYTWFGARFIIKRVNMFF
ncbi:hypothetical protein [Tellurirhabdus bombi]|uniref:hypothetical protein n=1 Tax=Tellurirhabdus bombi TaxID=2907205 RepID=UPI001F3A178D|nr:hypothetical protein [Tellurirhabdus bombi]